MSLSRRVARLEEHARVTPAYACTQCGLPPHGLPEGVRVRLNVPMPHVIDSPVVEDISRDYCPRCGRQLVFRIRFDRDG